MKATEKQISYALFLARKAGLSINWMDSSWKPFTTMRERGGKVEDFLADLNRARMSEIIDALKQRAS